MSKLVTVIVIAADCNDLGEVRSRTYFFCRQQYLAVRNDGDVSVRKVRSAEF